MAMAIGLATLQQRLGQATRNWARRRQGLDPLDVSLASRRIYILPTRAGLVFAVITFVMLLGAMNYNNNLGFALTFLLAAIAVVSINHCHYNLAGLRLITLGAQPVFAGEQLAFRFALHSARDSARWQIRLQWDGGGPASFADLDPRKEVIQTLPLPTECRGLRAAPRVRVSTRYPLGLFEAWAWLNLELDALVYPQPAEHATGEARGDQALAGSHTSGEDDYSGMRQWRPGDSPRRVAWKALARTGQYLVHEYEGAGAPVWIDWESEAGSDTEERIARLTRRVLNADAAGQDYGLRLPDQVLDPNRGNGHRHRCLRGLALCGPGAEDRA